MTLPDGTPGGATGTGGTQDPRIPPTSTGPVLTGSTGPQTMPGDPTSVPTDTATAPPMQPTDPTTEPTDMPPVDTTLPTDMPPVEPTTEPMLPLPEEPSLVTSTAGAWWTLGEVTEGGTSATITVSSTELQTWDGMGGTFNERGWEALQALSAADRELALRLLYDPVDGAGFDLGRLPIGASDYAIDRYTLDDMPAGQTDEDMEHFSIERDREMLIPYVKAALAVNPNIQFWASPWTPPPWMKDNEAYDKGNMQDSALAAHALYLARYVQEYGAEGIAIKAVHPQNEPGWAQDYPSCAWTNQQMIQYIGTILSKQFEDLELDTEIWMGTMSNKDLDDQMAKAVLADATAKGVVKGIGLQWGLREKIGDYGNYGVKVWQTEHEAGNNPWEAYSVDDASDPKRATYVAAPAPNDQAYADKGWAWMKDWLTGGVNGYMAWNMVLDTFGASMDAKRPWHQNALLTVDVAAKKLNITPTYYLFRHFSQYVEPGAKRLGTQGGDAFAFKNPDGSIVTIVNNGTAQASAVTLSVAGKMLQFNVPAHGWATVNWQGE